MSSRGTVLVTGATGSIGRRLVPALRAAGFAVRGQYVRRAGEDPDVDWRAWNLLEPRDLSPLVEGCVGVIHLAAAVQDAAQMERLNVGATRDLAVATAAAGVRYVCHASSVVVYGSPTRRDVDETTPTIDPDRAMADQYRAEPYMHEYARTKVLSERALHALAAPMHVDIVRPVVVADPAKFAEMLGWGLPRQLLSLHRHTNYVGTDDVAAALVHLTIRGLAAGDATIETFNVSDPDDGSFRRLLSRLGADGARARMLRALPTPSWIDLLKDAAKYRALTRRYPLGLMRVSPDRLLATGFRFPIGYVRQAREAGAVAGLRSEKQTEQTKP